MIGTTGHLSEDERHMLADGTLPAEQRHLLGAHLRDCGECAADVERIRAFLAIARGATTPVSDVDQDWRAVRGRIEAQKVVPLAPGMAPARAPDIRRRLTAWAGVAGALVAAVVVGVIVIRGSGTERTAENAVVDAPAPSTVIAAVDSAHAYEAEAQVLLDRLELQRALLRPEASRALERDLRAIDVAIAELKDAIARDPENPALRQLLASSYRQKVELLKRAGNAS
jgi:hypothetical protein